VHEVGNLLYLKLSLTGDEPELIKKYKERNSKFPHETTLDQFFDQEQFEVYRQLGVHIVDGLFNTSIVGAAPINSTAEWFKRLAPNVSSPKSATPNTSTALIA
jgi:hypothetical protein